MKASVLKENLKTATNIASRFISAKAQLPILSNFLIKANKNKIQLLATNLETSVSISVGAKVEEEGEIAVSGKALNDLISNLTSNSVDLIAIKEQLNVSSNNFNSNILGSVSTEFPSLPFKSLDGAISIDHSLFTKALNKVLFAASFDETRPVLTGILFEFSGKNLTLVATDGFRLSSYTVTLNSEVEMSTFIVPRNVLLEISKSQSASEVKVSFDKENNFAVFEVNDIVFSSRIIEGTYPDYKRIVPASFVSEIIVEKELFDKSVKLASVFARESSNIIKFQIDSNNLIIKAESSASGNQENSLEIKNTQISGGVFEIMFNYKFIEDLIKVIQSDFINISFSGNNTAAKFFEESDNNFLHLIMPIKTTA